MFKSVELVVKLIDRNNQHVYLTLFVTNSLIADDPEFRLTTGYGYIYDCCINDAIAWVRTVLVVEENQRLEFIVRDV